MMPTAASTQTIRGRFFSASTAAAAAPAMPNRGCAASTANTPGKIRADSAVRQYDAMRRSADEISGLETGIVRIGTVSSVSAHWLPQG